RGASLLFLCVVIAVLPALAAEDMAAPAHADPHFVRPADIDLLSLLPPPPAPDSPRQKAELAELHRRQDARTPEREAIVKEDSTETAFAVVRGDLGSAFTPEKLPLTAKLMAEVASDENLLLE